MNRLYILAILCLSFISCNDFLEEKPNSQISSDNFFMSSDDAFSAVNILYRKGVPSFYGAAVNGHSTLMLGGFLAGFFDNQYKGEYVVRAQNLTLDSNLDNSQLQSQWQSCYETIVRNANYALTNLPECPGLTDAERNMLIAEAKFFRALNYFYLVRMFGAVPIITKAYESLDDLYVRRSTEDKVYNFIVTDLTEALQSGGLADKPMSENGFRISKGSVIALLSDVYLTMAGYPIRDESKYKDAADMARLLINNNNYALIENKNKTDQSAFNTLRTSDNEKEYLYTIEYDNAIAIGGGYPVYCFPQEAASWGEFPRYNICNLAYDPISLLHSVYDSGDDIRYQEQQYFHSSYTQVNGNYAGTVRQFGKPLPYFWFEEEALLETGVSTKDRVHYRLTEIYLIAAEAIVKSERRVTDEAVGYLAKIKHRASLNKTLDEIKEQLSKLSADQFVQEVWREKIREFIFECKIWGDITRTRMYPAAGNGVNLNFVPLIGTTNVFGGTYTENNLYLPICTQELQRNQALLEPPI